MYHRSKPKRFIAGIFYDPYKPYKLYTFRVLPGLSEIPHIDSLEDWHGKRTLDTDEQGNDFFPAITGWKDIFLNPKKPQGGLLKDKRLKHLIKHENRFPGFIFLNDFDTLEEAKASGNYFKEWWDNGGWKSVVSEQKAELIDNYPDNRIENPVKDLSTGTIYPSTAEAARATGTSQGNISKAARGLRKTAGGTSWAYVDLDTGKPTPKEHKSKISSRVSTMLWLDRVEYDTLSDREKLELFDELYPIKPLDGELKAWVLAIDQDGKVRPFSGEKLELMLEFIRMANAGEFIRQGIDSFQISEDLVDLQLYISREEYFEAFLRYAMIFSRLMGRTPKAVNHGPENEKVWPTDDDFDAENLDRLSEKEIKDLLFRDAGIEFPYLQEVRDAKGTGMIRGRLENSQNPQKPNENPCF